MIRLLRAGPVAGVRTRAHCESGSGSVLAAAIGLADVILGPRPMGTLHVRQAPTTAWSGGGANQILARGASSHQGFDGNSYMRNQQDTIGPIVRSVADAATVLFIAGRT